MKSQNSLLFIILLSLVLGAMLFNSSDEVWEKIYPKSSPNEALGEEQPEYQINGFQSKKFNDDGILSSTLDAKSLSYYASDKSSLLSQPLINIHPKNKSGSDSLKWQLSAEEANSIAPNNRILLNKNIEMVRMRTTKSAHDLKIYSEKMELLMAEKIAKSDQAVTIMSNKNKIMGKDFTSDLDKNFISLKSNVKSEYIAQEENDEEQEPLYIQADSFLLEGNGKKAVYEGNVVLIQSDITIYSDKIEVIKEGENQIAFAYGKPAKFNQLATGNNQPIYAEAKRFEFDSREEKLKMYENARLIQGDGILEGGYLYYDTQTENIGAESKTEKRVKMTLPSQNKP